MQIFKFCFQCPGRFSELLAGSLVTDEMFIEALISHALLQLFWVVSVDNSDCWQQI